MKSTAMRKNLLHLAAAAAIIFTGCEDPVTEESRSLYVTPESLSFTAEGGTEYVEVRTDAGSWSLELEHGESWCTPELTSGRTSTTFGVKAAPNGAFQEFIRSEGRYKSLLKANPAHAEELYAKAEKDAAKRMEFYQQVGALMK